MATSQYPLALPEGSLILITGANGYVASHIADQTLKAGYRVRGTVRDPAKAAWMISLFDDKYGKGRFELVTVPDMNAERAFDAVMQSCQGVVHAASVLTFESDPNKVIPQTVRGAVSVLEAAKRTPSVKRVVYTSSSMAATMIKPNVRFSIGPETWNEEAEELAWAPPPYEDRAVAVYAASKTSAEKACWDFMKKEEPQFVLNSVLPCFNLGNILHESQPGSTAGVVKGTWNNDATAAGMLKGLSPQFAIDVVDDALLHVAALIYGDVKSERLLGYAKPFNFNQTVQTMKKIDPSRQLPDLQEDNSEDISSVETSRCIEMLKRFGQDGWTSFEASTRATVGA